MAYSRLLLGCTPQEMGRILSQHNTTMMGGVLIERPPATGGD